MDLPAGRPQHPFRVAALRRLIVPQLPPARSAGAFPTSENQHMKSRTCNIRVTISNDAAAVSFYALRPVPAAEVGQSAAAFRLVNLSKRPAPVYVVRIAVDGQTSCNCPAHNRAAKCKHADALLAAGVLPSQLVAVLQNRTRLLDAAEAEAHARAEANLDYSKVNLNALKLNLDKALDIYADLILHPAFPEKEFQRLQKERIAAIQRQKVSPVPMGLRVLPTLLYGKGHPYDEAFNGTGTEAGVKKMTRDDLLKFHETWYKPNNATLLIVGDTTLAEITPKLEKLFASWKPGDVPTIKIPDVPQPAKDVVYLMDRPAPARASSSPPQLAPPYNSPNQIALDLVNDIFGDNFSSRINMNLREDKHWSYGVGSRLIPARGERPFVSFSPVQTPQNKRIPRRTNQSIQKYRHR